MAAKKKKSKKGAKKQVPVVELERNYPDLSVEQEACMFMRANGYSVRDAAAAVKVTRAQVYHWEGGNEFYKSALSNEKNIIMFDLRQKIVPLSKRILDCVEEKYIKLFEGGKKKMGPNDVGALLKVATTYETLWGDRKTKEEKETENSLVEPIKAIIRNQIERILLDGAA